MTTYDIGDSPRVTAEFHDLDTDALMNPTTVTAKHVAPDGTTTSLGSITNPTTGVYKVMVPTITQAGQHVVKFFGTGTLIAAEEVSFTVRATRVT